MKSEKFLFQLFLTTFKIALAAYTLWQNNCKAHPQRKFVTESIHITIQISKYTNENFWKKKTVWQFDIINHVTQD